MAGLAMKQKDVIRMAYEAGIIPWCQMHWSDNQFVTIDEGMDGDLTCLMQFAALIAAAERKACAKVCEETDLVEYEHCMVLHIDGHATLRNAAAAIRARGQE